MASRLRLLIAGATALALGLLAACGSGVKPDTSRSAAPALPPDRVATLVDGVVQKDGKDLRPARLGAGLVPPTNRWFSGLVFGPKPLPVYPMPASFALQDGAFEFGLPSVVTTEKTIMGTHAPAVSLAVGKDVTWTVSGYDELGVTIQARRADTLLGSVHLVQGSPYITYTAATAQDLTSSVPFTADGKAWSAAVNGTTYGLAAQDASVTGTSVHLDSGGRASWFPVAQGTDVSAMAALAADPVTAASSTFAVADKATTTIHYATEGGGPTAFAVMPHQRAGLDPKASCDLGTYATAYGSMALCSGSDLTWATPTYEARTGLDLSSLTAAEKDELRSSLRIDIAALKPYPADTYFGGKALYRDAMLYQLARQLDAPDEADKLHTRLTTQLRMWAEPQGCARRDAFCFQYDPANRGMVGRTPSFGSDEFNDHHFHYGYFLYAAGVVAADDPGLAKDLAPVMDLLAADIATSQPTAQFPQRRTFDTYASHSWASGTSPFADGNNQESSSEAVNAWAGLTLWARASGNTQLESEARWMHALEAQSANAYWTNFDKNDPVYRGFGHQVLPLNFGGKRDYATWFSPEPAAALSILLLPMSPSSDHLATDPARILANLAEGTSKGGYEQQYGDFMLMYRSLAGSKERDAALATARSFDPTMIDDGDSLTYLLAFIMSRH